ncbi:MAG: putative amidohydrolase [Burkholderiaceae bacterium]|jgi:predicted amidohydrolase
MTTATNPVFPVAAIQMVSTPSVNENLDAAARLVAEAAARGAQLVLLPEYWPVMGIDESDKIALAEAADGGPIQQAMADMARRHGIWLVGGTLPMLATEAGKIRNTTLVYNPAGELVVRYDKIHLFSFSSGAEAYDEARTIAHGADVMTFDAPCGRVGLSVCYDLRFPEMYRAMGSCALIVVPAAFTYTTGQAHWEILLRARAIENQCYVLASGQGGRHENGRRTWGHSMLIDPWGKVCDVLPEGEGLVFGQVEPNYLEQVRASLPALQHRRL